MPTVILHASDVYPSADLYASIIQSLQLEPWGKRNYAPSLPTLSLQSPAMSNELPQPHELCARGLSTILNCDPINSIV